jgi:hypothetical protein
MNFSEAYSLYGPDVELIAEAMGITPPEADRLISQRLNEKYLRLQRDQRNRAVLAEIRARRPA